MNENNKTINWKNVSIISIIILCTLILIIGVPIFLDNYIFGNNIKSNLENSEWANFLGSFLGGILGATIAGGITILGIFLTIRHNKNMLIEERIINENKETQKLIEMNRPYFHIQYIGSGGSIQSQFYLGATTISTRLTSYKLTNIGLNSAVKLKAELDFCEFDMKSVKKNLFNSKVLILREESFEIKLGIPVEKTSFFIFFEDIFGNKYRQNVIFDQQLDDHVFVESPVLIKN